MEPLKGGENGNRERKSKVKMEERSKVKRNRACFLNQGMCYYVNYSIFP
jgi:hypothetical protein